MKMETTSHSTPATVFPDLISNHFDLNKVLHDLHHYLPAQSSLKDFIHHNTLHAFQHLSFFDALRSANEVFGYKTTLSLAEYRALFKEGKISEAMLDTVLQQRKGKAQRLLWKELMLKGDFSEVKPPRIGLIRGHWKKQYAVDLDNMVHPLIFRVLCSFLDQGISIWNFPVKELSLLEALRKMEAGSLFSFFKSERARQLLLNENTRVEDLLDLLIGKSSWYGQYLFDQQFAHSGWSGMVAVAATTPGAFLDSRNISLKELITFELLLEIDTLDYLLGEGHWKPLGVVVTETPAPLFDNFPATPASEVTQLWQEAFEWTYFDQVVFGLLESRKLPEPASSKSFQAIFCIDDRECSFRRHLENIDPDCETFGTPGFFSVDSYFQPMGGKFVTKICPAPVQPKHVIQEKGEEKVLEKDLHLSKHSHSFHSGWLIAQTLGFWSAIKLFLHLFVPSLMPGTASALRHMDHEASITVEHEPHAHEPLQVGYTVEEMTDRVERLLVSIGLVHHMAPLIYVVGHGASSVNNPHYAAYDCGACSGRAGSVNARAFAHMANHPEVRDRLKERGLNIPANTLFIGALRDTTRDEVHFFDEQSLSHQQNVVHTRYAAFFEKALQFNARERSRRFENIDSNKSLEKIHQRIKRRSVSLFEPRPELNHATNALCIVGRRSLSKGLFLDRRSFLNSYDYALDPDGKYLAQILNAATPVCGGINLEYYFSRVDNHKLGAGTKLPHNVMGLFGVANGIDGDLRPGLPSQMIEVHDPVRLLMVVEHFPETVIDTLQKNPATYDWFLKEWVLLVVIHPESKMAYRFEGGEFHWYEPLTQQLEAVTDLTSKILSTRENLPVYLLNHQA
jgi:hypothetical protein